MREIVPRIIVCHNRGTPSPSRTLSITNTNTHNDLIPYADIKILSLPRRNEVIHFVE